MKGGRVRSQFRTPVGVRFSDEIGNKAPTISAGLQQSCYSKKLYTLDEVDGYVSIAIDVPAADPVPRLNWGSARENVVGNIWKVGLVCSSVCH
jgi:hypothetical protein